MEEGTLVQLRNFQARRKIARMMLGSCYTELLGVVSASEEVGFNKKEALENGGGVQCCNGGSTTGGGD